MGEKFEDDGLLSVAGAPIGSTSWQADYFARQHIGLAEYNVRGFHALSERYHEKLIAHQFPDVAIRRRLERERRLTP